MEALRLDPDGYAGTYKLIGGRISLDFVNTLAWAGTPREHDWFEKWPNVVTWSLETGLLGATAAESMRVRYASDPKGARTALAEIADRREVLGDVLAPLAGGGRPTVEDLAPFNTLLARTCGSRTIEPETLTWTWGTPSDLVDLTSPIILDAACLIAEGDHRRLGECPTCKWLFYDRTRNRSRRWCDMLDCGSRDKARRYYHRQRLMDQGFS